MMYVIIARAELERAENSRSSTAGNPRFAQQNPRMVKTRTLHLPHMYTYISLHILDLKLMGQRYAKTRQNYMYVKLMGQRYAKTRQNYMYV